MNTVYNPLKWRLRGSIGWGQGRWSVITHLNYANDYLYDLPGTPLGRVSSWTTADLRVGYDIDNGGGKLVRNTDFSLNILNMFDRDPPRIVDAGSFGDAGYDSQNANPLGRFVSFQITKKW